MRRDLKLPPREISDENIRSVFKVGRLFVFSGSRREGGGNRIATLLRRSRMRISRPNVEGDNASRRDDVT